MPRRSVVFVLLASSFVTGCGASRASVHPGSPSRTEVALEGGYRGEMAPAPAFEAMPAGLARPSAAAIPGSAAPARAPARPVAPSSDAAGVKGKQAPADKAPVEDESKEHVIIYTGGLTLLVEAGSFATAIDTMVEHAARVGGFVARHDDRSITLRVPSARFRESMRELEKLGEVQSRNVEAQDVTEEYHDLGIRLKSLQATRKRLEELLARAANIHDVLEVEEQLARVNGEIDRIEGRLRFLASHAAMSTIHVSLLPRTPSNLQKLIPPPPPPRTVPLPIRWLSALGIDRLLELSR
jgi:hypothetical protein